MKRITLLVDWSIGQGEFWLARRLNESGFIVKQIGIPHYGLGNRGVKWRKLILWRQYFDLAIKALRCTSRNDVIVSWNFVVGAFAGCLNHIFRTKRKILSLNMIVHNKGRLNNWLRKTIYLKVLNDKNFFATTHSTKLIEHYQRLFGFQADRVFLLHDSFQEDWEVAESSVTEKSVFCGGDAARDWATLLRVARMLPEIKFICIARRKCFDFCDIPANVEWHFDVTSELFYEKLKSCMIVALPLDSFAPAGLIVMMRAALLGKPIIITETPSTKNYIDNGINGWLISVGDHDELETRIRELLDDNEIRKKFALGLKEKIVSVFSPQAYAAKLAEIINKNVKEDN